MAAHWRPEASLDNLRLRAAVLAQVRAFFAARDVLEVETPLLCQATVTDLHLDSIAVALSPDDVRFLQTSPEFAMKRLLAAGSGPIYQLCKAFRRDECGSRHNPEFSMLEWYRPGFDDAALMDEVEALLRHVLPVAEVPPGPIERLSYRALFMRHLFVDPFEISDDALCDLVRQRVPVGAMMFSRDDALNLLMSHCIEPVLQQPCFVCDFPASQAALAQVMPDEYGTPVARRFELFAQGMELANGYLELTCATEQAARFGQDNRARADAGLPVNPVDTRLLEALQQGLPDCAGVALGFDRLVMLVAGADHIREVVSFTVDRA